MELKFKVGAGNLMYIKNAVKRILSENIRGLVKYKTVVLYPNDANYKEVKKSLQLIMKDIDMRIEDEEKEE